MRLKKEGHGCAVPLFNFSVLWYHTGKYRLTSRRKHYARHHCCHRHRARGRRGRHRAPERRGDPARARGAVHAGGRSFGCGASAAAHDLRHGARRRGPHARPRAGGGVLRRTQLHGRGERGAALPRLAGRFAGGPARRVCRRRAAGAGGGIYRARVSERQNGPHRGGGGHRPHRRRDGGERAQCRGPALRRAAPPDRKCL